MRHIRIGVIALLIFGMAFIFTSIVCADQGVNATPEIQSLGTNTNADVVGLVMETDAGVWTLTNNPSSPGITVFVGSAEPEEEFINNINAVGGTVVGGPFIYTVTIPDSALGLSYPGSGVGTYQDAIEKIMAIDTTNHIAGASGGIHTGALDPGQIQYTNAYDANIVAQGGHTSFVKQMNLHTGNKVISQSNLLAQTALAYTATSGGGNVVGSENLMLDGAGNTTTAHDRTLCPFASAGGNYIPAYCNIVQMGSNYDLTVGSVTTQADTRFVGTDVMNPIVQNFQVNVKPYETTSGSIPAMGTTSAYIRAHLQEARNNGTPLKSEDLQYSETSSARGTITRFSKSMAYSSQFTGSPKESTPTVYHTITATAAQGTWISPSGSVQVPDHGSQTFTMGESSSGSPVRIIVNGVQYGFGYTYPFSDVTSDQTIEVQHGA